MFPSPLICKKHILTIDNHLLGDTYCPSLVTGDTSVRSRVCGGQTLYLKNAHASGQLSDAECIAKRTTIFQPHSTKTHVACECPRFAFVPVLCGYLRFWELCKYRGGLKAVARFFLIKNKLKHETLSRKRNYRHSKMI